MKWVEFSISIPSEQVERVSSVLGPYGHGGPIIEEWESETTHEKSFIVKIYVVNNTNLRRIRQEIIQKFLEIGYPPPGRLMEQILKPEDWFETLKKHFGILDIGDRFIIKPSWIYQPLPDSTRIVIEIDPGAAFGTGLHPTTRLCLLRIEKHLNPGMSVLDLGTGSGILSIASAKLGASFVLGLDIDPVAVKVAQSNSKSNKVDENVKIKRGTLSLKTQGDYKQSFDLVLANITAKTIIDLSNGFYKVLKPGGRLIVSGIQLQALDEVLVSLAVANLNIEAIDHQDEWCVVVSNKPKKKTG
jgi:ribosomal protein L11 methyltransferase